LWKETTVEDNIVEEDNAWHRSEEVTVGDQTMACDQTMTYSQRKRTFFLFFWLQEKENMEEEQK
jgi:hypothetical protein